jgi:hypothetical protein
LVKKVNMLTIKSMVSLGSDISIVITVVNLSNDRNIFNVDIYGKSKHDMKYTCSLLMGGVLLIFLPPQLS